MKKIAILTWLHSDETECLSGDMVMGKLICSVVTCMPVSVQQ